MIYLFSSARSGSTWLGKIFDSHPDVLYLHEPEIADRGMDLLPFWFDDAPMEQQIEAAGRYLQRMLRARTPRATGTRPFFRKSYRGAVPEQIRRALVYMAKGSERVGFSSYSNRLYIRDLARGKATNCVIKSVSALGRAEAIIKAAGSDIRPVLLLRHPCGYVNSMLRGDKIGVMKPIPSLGTLLNTRAAKRLGATPAVIEASDDIEKLAWNWLLANAEAHPAIVAAGGVVVVYENFASDATNAARALFTQLGLSWAPETENFLRRSAESEGGYYSVFRDPEKAANRWRAEISDATVARVRAVVTRDPLGQSFFPN